ncbi:MAG: flagellar hook-basal body protein [Lachnospiraceae bacterium]|jgi:flagellar hook-associated protein 3 FlgL|uniref:flagellin n=1 Tax=Hominisplanchenecus murintestinalis TaxID=2941517 RepID=UPI00203C89B8|nr:flagellin [Hominisplanchenecus murintestinalis]MCI9515377.1 flagellar hook-basal body protein [Lachnospiraceae bacterium]MCI9659985.1 flagellar hook-basal body protein [Lachnospiraceae bacterium]
MRVTNTSIYRNFTFTANDLHSKLIKSFSKIGGNSKKYESAAENPLAYYEGLNMDTHFQDLESKVSLIKDVKHRMYQQELGARAIQSALTGDKGSKFQIEKALNATSDHTSTLSAVRDELTQSQHEIVNALNVQYQNIYVFGGNDSSQAPFYLSEDGKTLTYRHLFPGDKTTTDITMTLTKQTDGSYEYVIDDIDSVVKAMTEQGVMDLGYGYIGDRDSLIDTYTGGLNVLTGITSKTARDMISLGKTDDLKALIQERMNGSAIALTGQAAFAVQDYIDNPTQDGLNTMNKVLGDTLSEIDASSIRLGTIYEELGIKYSRLDDTHTRLLSVQDSLTEAYADKLGADPYEAIMEMVSNQYSYNAALQVGTKLMETSLFDFMR